MEIRCSYCRGGQWVQDEGQHVTIRTCPICGSYNAERHRPDPAPLPIEKDRQRVLTLKSVLDICQVSAILLRHKPDLPRLGRAHQSALDTVNYLFGYQGRKTIMLGRPKTTPV